MSEPRGPLRAAVTVALSYAVLSAAYIFISDRYLLGIAGDDPDLLVRLSLLKGLVFVVLSALVILVVVHRLGRRTAPRARPEEESADASDTRLRSLLDGTPHLFFFQQELDGEVTYVSPSVSDITGRSVAGWLGRHGWYLTADPSNERATVARRRHLMGQFDGEPVVLEVAHADGRPLLLEIHEFGVFRDGRLVGLQGIAHDVSAARRAEQQVFFQATLLDSVRNAVVATDRHGTVIFWNRHAENILGWSAGDVLGRDLAETLVPAGEESFARKVIARLRRIGQWEGEIEARRKDGGTVPLHVLGGLVRAPDGDPQGFVAVATDISERRRSERVRAALHRISEAASTAASLDRLFAEMHAVVAELMPARNFYIALHDPASDVVSFPYFIDELDPQPEPHRARRGLTEYVLRTGEPLLASPEVFDALVEAGEVESIGAPSIDWLGVPLRSDGRTIGVLVVQSYTEGVRYGEEEKSILTFVSHQVAMAIVRKRAEEALRVSEQRLRDIVEHSTNLFYSHTAEHVLTYVSSQTRQFLDCEPEEALVRWTEFATDNPINEKGLEATQRAIETGERQPSYQLELVGKRGRAIWVEVNEAPVVRDGRTVAIVGALTDITERHRAEEALRESEERYRRLVEFAPDGIAVHCDGKVVFVNRAAVQSLGFTRAEEVIGKSAIELVHPEFRELAAARMRSSLAEGRPQPLIREKFLRADGNAVDVEVASIPFTFQGRPAVQVVARDITDRLRLEEQLRQAQKMEAVGRLAGGVAHDFNNLLQAMLSIFSTAAARREDGVLFRTSLDELEGLVRRGSALTRQLLLFARRDVTRAAQEDLNAVVQEASELLRRLVRENIRFELELGPEPLPANVDQGQVEQVLLNLVVNAVDAMPEGGSLRIRTGRNGTEAWIAVSDTGTGITPELRERIFEPFFTTKAGSGSGLGLSVVHGIVSSHGGRIQLESARGAGSTFVVYLPLHGPPAMLPVKLEEEELTSPTGNGEQVLLVEDELAVREGLMQSLELLGYEVIACESAEEAMARNDISSSTVLLTDLMLPGIHGAELALRLRDRWPSLAVVIMSGYAEDESIRRRVGGGGVLFLQKPFDMGTLARSLRQALEGGREP